MPSNPVLRYAFLFLFLCVYLFFAIRHVELPGLQYDEVLFANAAMGNVDESFIEWEVILGGKKWPLMLMPYIGALKAYLYAPILAWFPPGAATARLPMILIGAVSLTLSYLLARRMLGRKTALLGFALLASDPAFIFSHRLDWGPVALMMFLKILASYLLWRWLEDGRMSLLYTSAFVLGLGLFDKAVFLWFVVSLAIALPLCFGKTVLDRLNARRCAAAGLLFLAGASILIAYNIQFSMKTFLPQDGFTRPGENPSYRWDILRKTLEGSAVYSFVNHHEQPGMTHENPRPGEDAVLSSSWPGMLSLRGTFSFVALILAIPLLLVQAARGRLSAPKGVRFVLLLLLLLSALIFLTPQVVGPHHFSMILPFSTFAVAAGFREMSHVFREQSPQLKLGTVIPALSAAILLIAHLIVNVEYLRSFTATGGKGNWSDAIYELAQHAQDHPERNYLLMDWGFNSQLLFLSRGNVRKSEAFVPMTDMQSEAEMGLELSKHLDAAENLYVFHAPPYENFALLDLFERHVRANGFEAKPVRTFFQRDGRPVYLLYEVVRPEIRPNENAEPYVYFREAEFWHEISGGGREHKDSASRRAALGGRWGGSRSDYAVYRFEIPRRVHDARLTLRYAFDHPRPQTYYLYLDHNLQKVWSLEATGGFGDNAEEWSTASTRLGSLDPGPHALRLSPWEAGMRMTLDQLIISEGAFDSKAAVLNRAPDPMEEVLGYLDRPDVRVRVTPGEIIAGKSTMTLQVENYEVSAIDLLYSLDGRLMPIVYDWGLDENRRVTLFVDEQTKRGVYRYLAIRDAGTKLPNGWIRVDATVTVR